MSGESPDSGEYAKALGRKVALHRKRRGLSQKEFAGLLGRSEAWVSQVERGVRRIDRMTVLEKIADTLDLPVAELAAEAPLVASAITRDPSAAGALRVLLGEAHALRAVLSGAGPVDRTKLRDGVDRAWQLTHAGEYTDLAELLTGLIPELEAAARTGGDGDERDLFRLLASAYQACGAALAHAGDPDAAWVAVDRSVVAAERARDPLLMAAGGFRLAIVFNGARRHEEAGRVAGDTADALALAVEHGDPAAVALCGALTLQRAVAAGRSNRAEEAYEHLRRAREMAVTVDGENDGHHTEFGTLNVELHEVAVAVCLGDAGRALRVAEHLDVSGLSAERRARFQIDVATARTQRRRVVEAVTSLEAALDLAPEMVRDKPVVRRLVSDLLTMSPVASDRLRRLARETGIPVGSTDR
ncbi:helix-turn-helix domain-containing protein [Streptomyces alkaliphilus]|uniref:Helix-turn-helix domain-containing protein n=1 Tax=Streptomyces alkaliphilus TaxID=1472722 RepID=A0A7W3TB09_9ACTN|nr:helix-turn-helix transcriptional regulator [Streptomyces alkaliphilus]MBB0243526.1 helix-turn-helix domain-containing protein [Streptomyces alkaliphilus]